MQNNDQHDESVIQGEGTPGDQANELPPANSNKARGAFDLLSKRPGAGQNKKKL